MKTCPCCNNWEVCEPPAPVIDGQRCWLCWNRLKRLAYKLDPDAWHRHKFGAPLPERVVSEVKNRDADFLRQRQPMAMLKMSGLKYEVRHRGTPQMVVLFRDKRGPQIDLYLTDSPGTIMYRIVGDNSRGLKPESMLTFVRWYGYCLKK